MKQYTKPEITVVTLDRPHTFDVTVSGDNDTWDDEGDDTASTSGDTQEGE